MSQETEAIDAVSRAINRITRNGRFAEFELSNGIVLTLKPVPPLLLEAVLGEYKLPDPPKVYMEEKGRDEENPSDPNYLKEIARLAEQQSLAIQDLCLAVGTTIKTIPEDYFGPNDDGWIAQIEFAQKYSGAEFRIEREDKVKRYLCWLRFYALETSADVALAIGLPQQLAGIREGEIEEIVDSFRGVSRGGADSNGAAEIGSANGNSANRAARRTRPSNRRT